MSDSRPQIDPVTFEVLNHRLLSITEEMGIQYMRCSGSNVLITGNDAATAIMQPDGALVSVGPYIVTQGNVLPLIVESTQRLSGDVGINDGDIFICNDPYLGAIHHPDFATVAPLFWKDELIGWVGASGHQLDTGGMDPGVVPPMSAWWPREPTKNRMRCGEDGSNTGVITVTSGRWVPPW